MPDRSTDAVFAAAGAAHNTAPIQLTCVAGGRQDDIADLDDAGRAWIAANGFKGAAGSVLALPGPDGAIARALVGIGTDGDPCGPPILQLGRAPGLLPKADYILDQGDFDPTLAAVAWGLGAYRFQAFKSKSVTLARLVVDGEIRARVDSVVRATHLGRDLINTPANALGPDDIATAVRELGRAHDADVTVHTGESAGFDEAFPLIAAVGRASTRPPRLCDLVWGAPDAPKVTLVGKGIAFDTGGLDLKPASAMLLMKKDMGGAASAIAAASMILEQRLPVRLRLIIAAAENSVAGDAFRPGDVITSRAGLTVEIGNTDAEGRLVLADALALADTESPDVMMSFATLTGAARVALGADLPAMFSTDNELADQIATAGFNIGDPVWRMPLWPG
ncbi:MAG: leucyl aminopeptidase family protein, partial [Pseudomonadota bacterium]